MKQLTNINRRVSIAPMMACTDRHYRYLARLLTQHTLLYTEMLTAAAVVHGDRERLLAYDTAEQPLALQLGGSSPQQLAMAARIAVDFGYQEINLNVGCPSDRVQAGRFGACLMKEPQLVADCIAAIAVAVDVPVTVKTRIGVDQQDSYQALQSFVALVAKAGCKTFILHARKAWLQGLSPRENRDIPPLRYDTVYQLKRDFPMLEVIINGGIKTTAEMQQHLRYVDGVMIGREAYANPYLLADFDALFFDTHQKITAKELVLAYLPYVARQLAAGVRLRQLVCPLIGLFRGCVGARSWRAYLSQHAGQQQRGIELIETALQYVD